MEILIQDSEILKNLLENEEADNFKNIPSLSHINFELLESYYNGTKIEEFVEEFVEEKSIFKLAEDMNYLICGQLEDVLIKIRWSGIDYTSLNSDLVKEIKELGKFIKIACGDRHSVGLRNDGSISVWGDYFNYQIEKIPSSSGKNFIAIACGIDQIVVIRRDGSIATFGTSCNNRKDDIPTDGEYVSTVCGKYHYIALRKDGTLAMWGDASQDQRRGFPN